MKEMDLVVVGGKYAMAEGYPLLVGQVGQLVRLHTMVDPDLVVVRVFGISRLIHRKDCLPAIENHHFTHLLQEEEDHV